MSDSKHCADFRVLLQGYLDNELSLPESLELERHVTSCASCAQELKNAQALRTALKNPSLYYKMPDGFEARIRGAVIKDEPGVSWLRHFEERFRAMGRSAAWVAAAIAVIFSYQLGRHSRGVTQRDLAPEVLSEHVRSLQAEHLLDVPSTDQHTVKPWFTGKLNFSPRVKDLKDQEFPLVGGRLDYLNGKTVAAIVFRRRGHVINLFTWPSTSETSEPRTQTMQGFNIIQWSENGMAYWVISDLNSKELADFVQLYRI